MRGPKRRSWAWGFRIAVGCAVLAAACAGPRAVGARRAEAAQASGDADEQESSVPEGDGDPVAPSDASDSEAPLTIEAAARGERFPVHGQVSTRYRYRAVDGEADHDVTSGVFLDVGDPAQGGWTGHVQGWLNWDVGGVSSESGAAFTDISDTWSDSLTARLYAAYADYHGSDRLETLRFGRQEVWETPVLVTFDGARAETVELGEKRWQLEAYGGVPAHFFESSSEGDLVLGLAASTRPWEGGRLRFDWMHLEDEALLGEHDNDILGLSVWQRVDERLRVDGRATMLDGDGRDARVRGTFVDPRSELTLLATYYVLYDEQADLVQELDPFTATLLTLEPYHSARVLASKPVREDLYLEAGYERRELLDSEDEGEFNHDYGRLHAAATALDVTDVELDVRVTGELWDANGILTRAWGLDVSHELEPDLEASIGSYFALYKYDFLLAEERDNVRTYYADLEWSWTRWTTFDVRYEFENGPLDDYHVVRVGMRWRF